LPSDSSDEEDAQQQQYDHRTSDSEDEQSFLPPEARARSSIDSISSFSDKENPTAQQRKPKKKSKQGAAHSIPRSKKKCRKGNQQTVSDDSSAHTF
jgi:hypothetical protein